MPINNFVEVDNETCVARQGQCRSDLVKRLDSIAKAVEVNTTITTKIDRDLVAHVAFHSGGDAAKSKWRWWMGLLAGFVLAAIGAAYVIGLNLGGK
jgi:hypothetical protein